MSKWINVNKELPTIPNGQEGIQVLVIIFDRGDYSRHIYQSYFKKVDYKGCTKDYWFHCNSFNCGTGEESYDLEADKVTDWMYCPTDWKDLEDIRDYIENNSRKEILLKFDNDFHVYPNISVYFALDYNKKKFTNWNYLPEFKYKKSDYMLLDGYELLSNIFNCYEEYGCCESLEDGSDNPITYELIELDSYIHRYENLLFLNSLEASDLSDVIPNTDFILVDINKQFLNNNYKNIESILLANKDVIKYIQTLNLEMV